MLDMTTNASDGSHATWVELAAELGPAPRCHLGLIALANDSGVEEDFRDYATLGNVMIATSRVASPKVSSVASLSEIHTRAGAAAALLMPEAELDAIAFACTSATIAAGPQAIRDAIQAIRPGMPVVDPISAALEGMAKLHCRRIALITPYVSAVNAIVADYIEAHDIVVAWRGYLPLTHDAERSRVTDAALENAIDSACDGTGVDGVFIACTALKTAHRIGRLEHRAGKPVVTSNQALAWRALRAAGDMRPGNGRGRLFHLE